MSKIPMRRYENAILDRDILATMLNMMDTVYVGMFDAEYPYVIPLSFGYELTDEKLYIYVHGAGEGHKIELWNRNPHVSMAFSRFFNYPDRHYMHTNHDYRSIMARGIIRRIDPKAGDKGYGKALQAILRHYDRKPNDFSPAHAKFMHIYVIECDWDHVTGKAENPVRTVEEVPFPDVYGLPFNDERHDYTDLYTRKTGMYDETEKK